MRLNKHIAKALSISRREATVLIQAGKISLNGEVVKNPALPLEGNETITYQDKELKVAESLFYFLFNKGKGTTTAANDGQAKDVIFTKYPSAESIFLMGEQDLGLTIVTNDKSLIDRLSQKDLYVSASYEIQEAAEDCEEKLQSTNIKITESEEGTTQMNTSIKTHDELRNLLKEKNINSERIDRIRLAGLTKKDLPRRHHRPLTAMEIKRLKFFGKL